jgi:hypothetical protein
VLGALLSGVGLITGVIALVVALIQLAVIQLR